MDPDSWRAVKICNADGVNMYELKVLVYKTETCPATLTLSFLSLLC